MYGRSGIGVCGESYASAMEYRRSHARCATRGLQGFDDREVDEILGALDARLSSSGVLFIVGQNAGRSTQRISNRLAGMGYEINPEEERADVKTAWVLVAGG